MRISPVPSLRWAGSTYVTLLRNTPLTIIIVFCVLGLWGQLGVTLSSDFQTNFFRLAVLGLSVYHAAFVCEALRSGVNTVPVGQAEAARAIGLVVLAAPRVWSSCRRRSAGPSHRWATCSSPSPRTRRSPQPGPSPRRPA